MRALTNGLLMVGVATMMAACSAMSGPSAKQDACTASFNKYCKDVKAGEGRIIKCLRSHDADLPADCRARVNTFAMYQSCLDDAVRLCPNLEPTSADIVACLRVHQTDLSMACHNELDRFTR